MEADFRAKGYQLITTPGEADAVLVVGLRSLKFEESMGYFLVGAEADSAIFVEVQSGTEEFHDQYKTYDEDRQLNISFGARIDEQVNLVLNTVFAQLLCDYELDHFLVPFDQPTARPIPPAS